MRRLGRHTMVYGLGLLLSKAVAFLMLPIYTRHLTPADYGVIELIEMTLDVIAITAGARIAVGVFRYYHKMEDPADKNAVVSTALIILATSYATVAGMTFIAANVLSQLVFDTTDHANLIRLASASLGFQALIVAPLAYIRLRNRSGLYVMANLAKLTIQLVLNLVLLVGLGMGVVGVFISSLTANVVVGCVLSVYLVREVGFGFSRTATRNLLRYGIPLMATQMATFLATFGDRYFLRVASDVTEVGIYSLAYQFGFLLSALGYGAFASVWEPARFEIAARPDRDALYQRAFVYMNLLLLTLAAGIVLFGSDLIRVMADPSFHRAGQFIPALMVAFVLQSWTSFQEVGIHVKERTEFITLGNWIAAAVALAGFWLLIPRYLGFGAIAATIVAYAVRHVVIVGISQHLWPVHYDWRPILRIGLLTGGAATVSLALPATLPLALSVPLRTVLFALLLFALWKSSVVLPSERRAIIEMGGEAWHLLRARIRGVALRLHS